MTLAARVALALWMTLAARVALALWMTLAARVALACKTDLAARTPARGDFVDVAVCAETAGFSPRLPTRISGISLPVASLIFAFCSSVSLILTSFAIASLLVVGDSVSQDGGQPQRDRVTYLSFYHSII